MNKIKKEHIKILEHMLGDKTFYRNHYALFKDSDNYDALIEMKKNGLVSGGVKKESIYGDMIFFYATDKGKKHAFQV